MDTPRTAPGQVVSIPTDSVQLDGFLEVPKEAEGIVIFAHGSGSGRFSPRNNYVAGALRRAGMATLLLDLLTEHEATDRRLVFAIAFLARRLRAAADWVRSSAATRHLAIGYFGASTGAGAALMAAANDPGIAAIVSRGGRPDLAAPALARVQAPTLLIVGGDDGPVIDFNEWACARLQCPKQLTIVPGAGHLFEEPGTLERVVELAGDWYRRYLRASTAGQEAQR